MINANCEFQFVNRAIPDQTPLYQRLSRPYLHRRLLRSSCHGDFQQLHANENLTTSEHPSQRRLNGYTSTLWINLLSLGKSFLCQSSAHANLPCIMGHLPSMHVMQEKQINAISYRNGQNNSILIITSIPLIIISCRDWLFVQLAASKKAFRSFFATAEPSQPGSIHPIRQDFKFSMIQNLGREMKLLSRSWIASSHEPQQIFLSSSDLAALLRNYSAMDPVGAFPKAIG